MQPTKPLISICITNYNKDKYIIPSIESALNQITNYEIEIIISDDFSTDNSRDILNQYQKKYPKIITIFYQTKNIGLIKNSLTVIKRAKGKYIAFLDSDDYWCNQNKLQNQVDFLEQNLDFGMIHTNSFVCEKGQIIQKKSKEISPFIGNVYDQLIKRNFITHSTVVIRKDLLELGLAKLDEKLLVSFYYNDYPIYLFASSISKIGYLNEKSTVYRNLPNSASHTPNLSKKILIVDSTFKTRMFFHDQIKDVSFNIIREIKALYHYQKLSIYSLSKNEKLFYSSLKQFIKYNRNFKYHLGACKRFLKFILLKYYPTFFK